MFYAVGLLWCPDMADVSAAVGRCIHQLGNGPGLAAGDRSVERRTDRRHCSGAVPTGRSAAALNDGTVHDSVLGAGFQSFGGSNQRFFCVLRHPYSGGVGGAAFGRRMGRGAVVAR